MPRSSLILSHESSKLERDKETVSLGIAGRRRFSGAGHLRRGGLHALARVGEEVSRGAGPTRRGVQRDDLSRGRSRLREPGGPRRGRMAGRGGVGPGGVLHERGGRQQQQHRGRYEETEKEKEHRAKTESLPTLLGLGDGPPYGLRLR